MALPRQWNGDVALASLNPASSFAELYNELWWYSGSVLSTTSQSAVYLQKGSTALSSSPVALYTHNSSWSPNVQCALEVSSYTANVAYAAYIRLFDVTSGTVVTTITNTNTINPTVIRSGTFTLTPGHSYAVGIYSGGNNYAAYITDASLIIFPPAPTTSPYDVASVSLANPSGNTLKESYVPLYIYDTASANQNGNTDTSAGTYWLAKGSGPASNSSSSSAIRLYALTSSWKPTQQFAFEASIQGTDASTSYFALWDFTSSAIVSASQISSAATTMTLVRSGSFTLTPGHQYGVTLWTSVGSDSASITKAHLVALAN